MYFRFGAGILLVVGISVIGVAVEKTTLGFRREISRQEYRREELKEEHERLRLRTQQLGAPNGLMESVGDTAGQPPSWRPPSSQKKTNRQAKTNARRPLLRWQRRVEE